MTCRIAIATGDTFISYECALDAPMLIGALLLSEYATADQVNELIQANASTSAANFEQLCEQLEQSQAEYCYVFENSKWMVGSILPMPVETDERGFGDLADALAIADAAEELLTMLMEERPVTLH